MGIPGSDGDVAAAFATGAGHGIKWTLAEKLRLSSPPKLLWLAFGDALCDGSERFHGTRNTYDPFEKRTTNKQKKNSSKSTGSPSFTTIKKDIRKNISVWFLFLHLCQARRLAMGFDSFETPRHSLAKLIDMVGISSGLYGRSFKLSLRPPNLLSHDARHCITPRRLLRNRIEPDAHLPLSPPTPTLRREPEDTEGELRASVRRCLTTKVSFYGCRSQWVYLQIRELWPQLANGAAATSDKRAYDLGRSSLLVLGSDTDWGREELPLSSSSSSWDHGLAVE
ncbi:hypothetical protein DFH11DRAFT_1541887 [Phellopilus nigrolimitatus]|nr:hypothetical protein DFH11DRAFT_1541887 [Phellopilus nigrolimitatus]